MLNIFKGNLYSKATTIRNKKKQLEWNTLLINIMCTNNPVHDCLFSVSLYIVFCISVLGKCGKGGSSLGLLLDALMRIPTLTMA